MKTAINSKLASKAGVNIAIIGASGYTGLETIRVLLKHPKVRIKILIGEKTKGKKLGEICSSFSSLELPKIVSLEEANFKGIDVIFSCMPSGNLAAVIDIFPENLIIIDLSADFRIKDINLYENYYGNHENKKFLKKFTYGLSEICRKEIKKAKFISCPGCYPTSILLPLIPIIKSGLISMKDIIADSKSGITGAGRNLKHELLFTENTNSFKAYGEGKHRHIPEIEHHIFKNTSKKVNIIFTPHLIPINRGILSTIYIKGKKEDIEKVLKSKYNKERFVLVNKTGDLPKISDVTGTNNCRIGLLAYNKGNYVVLVSVIDNLMKGAAGQAVQNMNIVLNYAEDLGLDQQSFWP